MDLPFPIIHSNLNPTLKAELNSFNATVASHPAAVEATAEMDTLCQHAIARGYFQAGIQVFRVMTGARPPAPHGKRFNLAVVKFNTLNVNCEAKIYEWKKKVNTIIKKMKRCTKVLQLLLNHEDIKIFLDAERQVVVKKKT